MPLYQFYCKEHGEFDKFLRSTYNLSENLCPECGKSSKREFYAPDFHWRGTQAPNFQTDVQKIRLKNNKKLYGETEAIKMEIDHDKRMGNAR